MITSPEQAQDVLAQAELVHDADAVAAAVERMAAAISADLSDQVPVALCVMTGGLIPAGWLLPQLKFPLEVDYVHASRYNGRTRGGELVWVVRPRVDLSERTVLIIDDILDEGHTLAGIVDECFRLGARAVHSAVLVNKRHSRRYLDFEATFVGLDVDDRYVFGAGMDYKGLWRNLPAIYAVEQAE